MMTSCGMCFMWFLAAIIVVLFYPGLPPNLEFEFIDVPDPRELNGALSVNNMLDNAERLFENEIKGPESFAIYNNVLYLSSHGGNIMKLVDGKLVQVLRTGQPCEGYYDERVCGRPLGLKFGRDGTLYIADAYYGILKANVNTGEKTILAPMDIPIDGKVPMLPNSIAITSDGIIYWTDSSTTHYVEDGVIAALGKGTGRLIMYDPNDNKNHVLLDELEFPNGVEISSDETFLIIAETLKARVLKFYIKGALKGQTEVFIDRLPGVPDNLRLVGENQFMVALLHPECNSHGSFRSHLGQWPMVRKLIARTLTCFDLLFENLNYIWPNPLFKKAASWIGHFESLSLLHHDKRSTVIILSNEGTITGSMHATDGSIRFISDIIPHNGFFYLGSPYNNYLGRVQIQ